MGRTLEEIAESLYDRTSCRCMASLPDILAALREASEDARHDVRAMREQIRVGTTQLASATAEAIWAKDLAAKWKAVSVLQDSLLACYRTGRNPGRVLDQLAKARSALAGDPEAA